jgi:uncharacterized protein
MRIKKEKIDFLKKEVVSILPESNVFLFGSRVNNNLKGGDIDIMVLGERPFTNQEKRNIRVAFYKKFGEQKIDIISFVHGEASLFKDMVIQDAVKI